MADKKKTGGATGPAVGDARFQKVHNDPRFARLSSKKNKLQIDKRFAAVLEDDKFQSVQGKYDKYGRRIDKKQNELKKFYRLDDEDDKEQEKDGDDDDEEEEEEEESSDEAATAKKTKAKAKKPEDSSDEKNSEEEEEEEEAGEGDEKMSRLDYLNRMARGELESDSDDSDMSDEDVYMEEDEVAEKEDIPLGDETKRFAVMNCDWTRIRAVDLFALFQSFSPATGAVKDVTIYPSDFGIERMQEEEQHGPRQLWADKETAKKSAKDGEDSDSETASDAEKPAKDDADSDEEEDNSEDEEEDDGYDSDDPLGVKKRVTANESDGFDVEKLRKYELQKLKYYYAVVSCDSVKTAAAIYENCDQLEYETSANLLDLRFIPDEMEFANKPKESCQSVPETYKPAIFATAALQQTDITLTWEEDDDNRVELLTRQAEWKNANDDDFAAYLASENSSSEGEDSEDDSDDEAVVEKTATTTEVSGEKSRAERKKAAKLKKIKNRYRKMLLGSDAEDSDDSDDDPKAADAGSSDEGDSADDKPEGMDSDSEDENGADDADQSGDREMSFTPGASDILRAKRQKELEANETPFERYIREKKLEKNKKRHDKRSAQKLRQQEQKEVLMKKGKAAPEQLQALRAAIDDNDDEDANNSEEDGDRNFDMKKISLNEKVKKLKGKRKNKELKKLDKKSGLQEGFAFDAVDPRFGKLYEKGSQFQLDPTDPKFKKTEATQAIFQERRKRQTEPKAKHNTKPNAKNKQQPQDATSGATSSKSELKAMVENLKRKAAPTKSKQPAAMKPFKKAKM